MKIALAVPYEGHDPDEVIEVPSAVGSSLVHLGSARRVPETAAEVLADDPAPDASWKPAATRAWCKRHGIAIPGKARTTAAMLDVIEAAVERGDPAEPVAVPDEDFTAPTD